MNTDPKKCITIFGTQLDSLDMAGAVDKVMAWLSDSQPNPTSGCRYVVTPNVDHIVMLQSNNALQQAYEQASLVLADGFPLVVASKILGKPLPERVAGSELVPALFTQLGKSPDRTRVFLLGAMPGVAVKAARAIDREWPHINVVGTYSPPKGFENDEAECANILRRLEQANPELILFGVGAPKQEIWTHRHRDRLPGKVLLCIGATIDFLAGEKQQAPVWMRRSGLEWVHRCATEPGRLLGRYARDAVAFPQIFFRELTGNRAARKS